ncbi:MAG: Fibronectin type-III protein [Campylobacterota bacterium]|nr:Fibronectin type-III protein [Campylobacterota bacterium]
MKKSTLLLWVLGLLAFSGCGSVQGLMIYEKDASLNTITQVKALPTMNTVGFEWQKIEDSRVRGVNIYRGVPQNKEQGFKQIGSVNNRYATHFVDTQVSPDTEYVYTFTTFSLGKESEHGKVLHVKTRPTFNAVSFVQAYKVASDAVKVLWRPHTDPRINAYIIQRAVDGGEWQYVSLAKGQLMAEYIDIFVRNNHTYQYRIIAKSYDGIEARTSQITSISL